MGRKPSRVCTKVPATKQVLLAFSIAASFFRLPASASMATVFGLTSSNTASHSLSPDNSSLASRAAACSNVSTGSTLLMGTTSDGSAKALSRASFNSPSQYFICFAFSRGERDVLLIAFLIAKSLPSYHFRAPCAADAAERSVLRGREPVSGIVTSTPAITYSPPATLTRQPLGEPPSSASSGTSASLIVGDSYRIGSGSCVFRAIVTGDFAEA